MRELGKANQWMQLLANAIIVCGVITFFVERYIDNQNRIEENTLHYVRDFQSREYVGNRYFLLRLWEGTDLKAINRIGIGPVALRKLVLDRIYGARAPEKRRDIDKAIFEMVDFVDSFAVCVHAGRCDRHNTGDIITRYASEFFCIYRPIVASMRDAYALKRFGNDSERLVKDLIGESNCARA